jgi:hypothetical protein
MCGCRATTIFKIPPAARPGAIERGLTFVAGER